MIYTITFNPALDYITKLQNFEVGKINRSKAEYIVPGGKGINVSIILKELGIDSTALGFTAGFIGKEIERKVKEYGIKTEFIQIDNENSRINVKITTDYQETAINGKGPFVDPYYLSLFSKKIEKMEKEDILILSGSVPEGIENNIYQGICQIVEKKKVKVIIDTTGDLLLNTLAFHPFLIKPNKEELEEIFHCEITSQEEALQYAKKLQQKGACNVLVSMGKKGCVFLDEDGKTYKREALASKKENYTVGAGDSMVAGFVAGYQLYKNYEQALKMGIAAATATINSFYLATKQEIDRYL